MVQLILLAADTIAIFGLIHMVGNLVDRQSEYEDVQHKQDWRIQNLELDKYKLKYHVNDLERQVKERNANNDNACS